jgi:hypothetical protein
MPGFVGVHVLHVFSKLNHLNLNLKAGGCNIHSTEDAVRTFNLSQVTVCVAKTSEKRNVEEFPPSISFLKENDNKEFFSGN